MDQQSPNTPDAQAPAAESTPDPMAVMWREHAEADFKAGRITAEQHAGIMGELGLNNEQAPAAAAPDQVGDYLTAEGFPPAQEKTLRLREHLATADEKLTPEMRATESTITAFILDSKMPAGVANHLIAEVAKKTGPRWQAMTEVERVLHGETTRAHLQKMWGAAYGDNLALAQSFVKELDAKHGGKVSEILKQTGAGSSLAVIANVFLHAQRLAARHGKQK